LILNAIQLFFNSAAENTIELSTEEALDFISKQSLSVEKQDGVYLIKHEKNALDLGVVKEGVLSRKNI